MQTVKHLDAEFTNNTSSTSTVQIDSDITKTSTKFVFFARDNVTQQRYKVMTPPYADILFGDCLRVSGTISLPEVKKVNLHDETLPLYNFPYRQYLAKDDVYLLLQARSLKKISGCAELSRYSQIKLFFMKQKEKLTQIFLTQYEQPYAGLVAGVLVAGKGLLDKNSLEEFKRTSLSHTVVLSGSNVSVILICIKMLVDGLFFWKRKKGLLIQSTQKIIIMIAVWVFMLITGGGAPIYRAVASAYCGMILFTEKTSQVYALSITVFILTFLSPFQTIYDPSFHLTCCATYGLILFSKPIATWMRLSRCRYIPVWLQEIISVTLATQVFVFPYIIYMTNSFSTVFLISNVLILPLLPFVMLFGCITVCADIIGINFLIDISVYINNILLRLIFSLVHLLAQTPYGYILITKTASIVILAVYMILLSCICFNMLIVPKKSLINNTPV